MAEAKLTIASKNYGSWSLRGWLLCKYGNGNGGEYDEHKTEALVHVHLLGDYFRYQES